MTEPVELITVAPYHNSVGDIATATATANDLANRGIPVIQSSSASGKRTCIIGGGACLLHGGGHWGEILARFRIAGRHILNAVHVQNDGDWSYLNDYSYLSVRDHESVDRLRIGGVDRDIAVVPCPAILIEPLDRAILESLPRWGRIAAILRDRPYVIHRTPELAFLGNVIRGPTITVQPRPWCELPVKWRFQSAPMTHSPEVMAAVVRQSRGVVSRSLHLCVFAVAAGVPCVVPEFGESDHQAQKIRAYLDRAGLRDCVVPQYLVASTLRSRVLASLIVDASISEVEAARAHLSAIAESIHSVSAGAAGFK